MLAGYPTGPTFGEVCLTEYISNLAGDYDYFGLLAAGIPVLFAVLDQPGFASAHVTSMTCPAGHKCSIAFVGGRLFLFIYRLGILIASCLQEEAGGALKIAPPGQKTHAALVDAVEGYFGDRPLDEMEASHLNLLLELAARPRSYILEALQMAEAFVLAHEMQHIRPPGTRKHVVLADPGPAFWASARGRSWNEEVDCDAEAVMQVMIFGAQRLSQKFSFSAYDARRFAAFTACVGAELALGSLELIERIIHGPMSLAEAMTHPEFDSYPPAGPRRNWLSHVGVGYVRDLCNLPRQEQDAVVTSAGAVVTLRDRLFDHFMETRADLVAEIRNAGP
jgi:hypothetical protein